MNPAIESATAPVLRLDIDQAANALRCSRAYLYKLIAAGSIRAQKDGKRRYVSVASLRQYVAALDAAAT